MPRPLFDSEFIHGCHEPGGEHHMLELGKPGWVLFTEELGNDENKHGGTDYRTFSDRGIGIIARLNNGYGTTGTIPHSGRYEAFARRCANFVAASHGCKIWLIGNEMNLANERPPLPSRGFDPGPLVPGRGREPEPRDLPPADDPLRHGDPSRFNVISAQESATRGLDVPTPSRAPERAGFETITPELYAQCFRLCRTAIRAVPGHGDDQVIIGSVAPWNNQTQYTGNPSGDWVRYFADILGLLGPSGCDGITIHTYTHGTDPALIDDEKKMDAPFHQHHYHFRTYRDFMHAVPANMRHLPVYVTETDQDEIWEDNNRGWVQRAYAEIDAWNQTPGQQQIRALILYRWPKIDKWVIEGKRGVIDDFRAAVSRGFRWKDVPPPPAWRPGDRLRATGDVNLRRTPGFAGKPADDVVVQVPGGGEVDVLTAAAASVDGATWWPVRYAADGGPDADPGAAPNTTPGDDPGPDLVIEGWMASHNQSGRPLLDKVADAPPFDVGNAIFNIAGRSVRVRRSPGFSGKTADDIVTSVPAGGRATVTGGPEPADDLRWWQVEVVAGDAGSVAGWMADTSAGGEALLAAAVFEPGRLSTA